MNISQAFESASFRGVLKKYLKPQLLKLHEGLVRRNHKNIRLSLMSKVDESSPKDINHVKRLIKNQKSVGGYIPFCSDQTEIIIYNFFSINYGFRSKGRILISLTDELFNPLHTKLSDIEHRQIVTLSLDIQKQVIDPKFCVVLLVHEQMKPNHGGRGGHLRFWGVWNNFAAFTHSMPLPESSGLEVFRFRDAAQSNLADRRIYPMPAKAVEHYSFRDGKTVVDKRGDLSDTLSLNFGFSVIAREDHRICSCYHNSPYTRQQIGLSSQPVEHVVAIPAVRDIEIYMFFGECCTIGSKFAVGLHTVFSYENERSNSDDPKEKVIEITSFAPIKLSSLFSDNPDIGKIACWLSFRSISGHHRPYYINVVYGNLRTQDVFDGVHSHSFSSAEKFRRARSLKFAPFRLGSCKSDNGGNFVTLQSWLVVWGDDGNSVDCRLRIFSKSDLSFERVYGFRINKREVKHIDLDDYIEPGSVKDGDIFLAQLESEQQNLNANLYCLQLTEGKGLTALAVDHLTGG